MDPCWPHATCPPHLAGSSRGAKPKNTASIPRTASPSTLSTTAPSIPGQARDGLITFDTELRLVCAPSLRDHFAHATIAQHFQAYEGQPLSLPAEAAGPKPEYLEYHRSTVFEK